MARRRMSAAQIRDRRSKKIAAVLGIVFVAVAAIQVPKLMKQLHHAAPLPNNGIQVAPANNGTVAAAAASPAAGATATTSSGSSGTASSTAATGTPRQLTSFTPLPFKDPFYAPIRNSSSSSGSGSNPLTSSAAASAAADAATSGGPPASASAGRGTLPPSALILPIGQASASMGTSTATPTATPTAPAAKAQPTPTVKFVSPPPNAALIKMNGRVEVVFVGTGFPSDQPMFKLVSLAKNKKGVRIGVVGGSFADGIPTLLIAKGHKITLADQSDGSRYVLQLVRLTNAVPPPPATATSGSKTAAPAATAATPVATSATPAATTTPGG